jgi:hypothetical protein
MTRKESQRLTHQENTLISLGFTSEEAEALRRISMTLHRWHEMECNGDVQRCEQTGKVYKHYGRDTGPFLTVRTADREKGALKRLAKIITNRNARFNLQSEDRNYKCDDGTFDIVTADGEIRLNNVPAHKAVISTFIQTDPRGAALYIIRPGDVPAGEDVSAYYNRGICVY